MRTIKKACKGVSYPKSSSVSKRLGSPSKAQKGTSLGMKSVKAGIDKNPGVTRADIIAAATKQAKKGMKIKKAQTGAKEKYQSSTNPKLERNLSPNSFIKSISTDTSGYAGGAKKFPTKVTTGGGKEGYMYSTRSQVKGRLNNPKQKMGGKTKKCAYGCK